MFQDFAVYNDNTHEFIEITFYEFVPVIILFITRVVLLVNNKGTHEKMFLSLFQKPLYQYFIKLGLTCQRSDIEFPNLLGYCISTPCNRLI